MELDSFLASPRWEILKIISEKPSSPIEIAKKTKTTVSFISQQLKLLEAARIVSKEKTGAFEKGPFSARICKAPAAVFFRSAN